MNHVNIFETKTDLELMSLYAEFLDAEKNGGFDENTELGKIKAEYEKDFGANTVIMTQIELTHTIADRWLKSCFESENDKIFSFQLSNEFTKKFIKENAVDEGFLQDWYQSSVSETDTPVWTNEHIAEMVGDFYLIPKEVVDKRDKE